MEKKLLSPKEVAALLHISLASVNYYTNIGLFRSQDRKGNMRVYNKERILKDFSRIKELRRRGYSLKLIRDQLET